MVRGVETCWAIGEAEPERLFGIISLTRHLPQIIWGRRLVQEKSNSHFPTPEPNVTRDVCRRNRQRKYSDRHLAGLSAGPPDRVELIGAGSLGYGTGPSFG